MASRIMPSHTPDAAEWVRYAYENGSEAEQQAAIKEMAAQRLTYEDWVRELTVLRLRDRPYSCDDYRRKLGDHVGFTIKLKLLSRAEFLRTEYRPKDRNNVWGRMVLLPRSPNERYIEVPDNLSGWLLQHTIFHELGHVAADHPTRLVDGGGRLEPSGKRLARRPPLLSNLPQEAVDELCEAEADLRAEYAIVTGSLGYTAMQTGRLTQIS